VDGNRGAGVVRGVEGPRVAVVHADRGTASFRAMMAENLLRMPSSTWCFAGIIAFGVVYNAARISLSARAVNSPPCA
jgi:hypothetical protein